MGALPHRIDIQLGRDFSGSPAGSTLVEQVGGQAVYFRTQA
jgi:hypothetical protein